MTNKIEPIRTWVLKAQCKKCLKSFEYTRSGTLVGSARTVCDACNVKRGTIRQAIVREG